ncbi:MAG: YggT family protein [Acetobacter sp.]|jgi:YggT family protein|nr:YggT family protein [Acetobacter sp.]MCH4060840.1 YggT family protein [Acetobacter sp.]MCH4087780.1 YggT family protein [Acetobacter sp.]MCI1293703.1 YggT family protein [Acetobacter sp.]MCI1319888.1 YggT family protein [Acetobacter sp.]
MAIRPVFSFEVAEGSGALITSIFRLLVMIANLYEWVMIIYCVFSMLYAFGVLDGRNRMVWTIGDFLARITEPVLQPIRNILPSFGNVDLSPLVVMLGIQYLVIPGLRAIHYSLLSGNMTPWFS